MTEKIQYIPARQKNAAVGGHIGGTEDIIDDALGKEQDQINQETIQALNDRYTKDETYSKTQLNSLITTPEQGFVNLTASDGDTLADIFDGVTGAADTIYRVGSWDGEQYDTTKYAEYAFDGTNFIPLSVKEVGIDNEPTAGSNNLVKSGGVKAEFNKMRKETEEDGLYICNEKGEVTAMYKGGVWTYAGSESTTTKGFVSKKANLAAGDTLVLTNNCVKNAKRIAFSGELGATFIGLTIAHSNGSAIDTSYIVVDGTSITPYIQNSQQAAVAHGITIVNNIQVEIVQEYQTKVKVKVVSNGVESDWIEVNWVGSAGNIYCTAASALNNVGFGWSCPQLNNGIWVFGDSYLSMVDSQRWPTYLIADGYRNFMLDGYGGRDSANALISLKNLLEISKPREIIWCMGMNDSDSTSAVNTSWKNVLDEVISICTEKVIELVLATIPTAVGTYVEGGSQTMCINKFKNAIVRASGYRYIDFDKAVGANETTGEWYNNGLANDFLEDRVNGTTHARVHPTQYGAMALYHRAISDAPELMM